MFQAFWHKRGLPATLLTVALVSQGCTRRTPPQAAASPAITGVASWYGRPFDGRRTASGEIFRMEQRTAAHRTLPFGSVVTVQNVANGKAVQVRINDRGPFKAKRLIDLSQGAAQEIGMPGTANVELHITSIPKTRALPVYIVQVGAFADEAQARAVMLPLQRQYGLATILYRPGDETWRVLVGNFSNLNDADTLADKLTESVGPAFTVLQDEND